MQPSRASWNAPLALEVHWRYSPRAAPRHGSWQAIMGRAPWAPAAAQSAASGRRNSSHRRRQTVQATWQSSRWRGTDERLALLEAVPGIGREAGAGPNLTEDDVRRPL